MRATVVLSAWCLSVCAALPATALAYDHQATAELGLGFAHAFGTPPYDENGPAAELGGSIGLGDTFALRASFTWASYPGASFTQVGLLGAEVVYLVDVLEVVPYFGLGVDAIGTYDGTAAQADFGVHAVAGFDWLFTRSMYVGVEARPTVVLTSLDTVPVQLSVLLRYGLTFEL